MKPTRLGAVIFDWAGTIVDHGSRAPARAFIELFRRNGMELSEAQARGPMGMGKKDHIRALAAIVAPTLGEDEIERLYREFIPLQTSVITEHADVIPGVPDALAECARRGLKVGTTTGYSREMVDALAAAVKPALAIEHIVCASDVSAGRPAPWMALAVAARLGVYPMSAIVKIGDTIADIDEGRNAGMWTVAVARTGNELGLSAADVAALPAAELADRLAVIRDRLLDAGAHIVIDSVADCAPILDDIDRRLAAGERP